ncbi:hypothetical protein N7507_010965 [Penicillium longicatenatum]|nr:hypothetical protein N7507_010965 [Penicillium longicatenatum]
MALRTSAEDAEDAAAGFTTFRAPLPEHAAEVTGLISDLYAISSSLTSLDAFSQNVQYRRNWPRVQSDVELVRSSLKYTFEDIHDYMHRLDNGRNTPENYKRVWVSMSRFFWDESQYALSTRLARYRIFLRELGEMVKNRNYDSSLLGSTRNGLRELLVLQEHRLLPQGLGSLELGQDPLGPTSILRPASRPPSRGNVRPTSRPPSRDNIPRPPSRGNIAEPLSPISPVSDRDHRRRRSFERVRPAHLSPQSPLSPSSGTGTFSDSIPPSVPEAPYSPLTGSVSATTNTSHSTQNDAIQYHWIKEIFSSYDTETAIPNGPEKAGCFDDSHPGIKQILKEKGFERILQLAFNDESEMTIYFYLRERDHRARIVCKVPHRTRSSEYFCLPLNMLEVVRAGSCLQLCRRKNSGKDLILWARLKFTTIESMVVFFCAFLALRSQDAGRPVDYTRDYELDDEEELFGGQIVDDNYPHALRVYQDRVSGAVRLQASVHKGIMDRTPVWNAFVTHQIKRRGWLKPLDSRTVLVRDLKLTILMSAEDYNPPTTARGEHVLKFVSRSDADAFLDTMEDIAMTIR